MAQKSLSRRKAANLSKLLPERIGRILGDSPVMTFEQDADFEVLHAEMIVTYDPQDFQDHLLVRDIADAQWQIMRLSEMVGAAVEIKMPAASAELLGSDFMVMTGCFHWPTAHQRLTTTVRKAVSGDSAYMQSLETCADRAGVSLRHLKTAAFALALPTVSGLWDLISRAEKRRDAAIKRLLDRKAYQTAMSRGLPAAAGNVIDVTASKPKQGRARESEADLD